MSSDEEMTKLVSIREIDTKKSTKKEGFEGGGSAARGPT